MRSRQYAQEVGPGRAQRDVRAPSGHWLVAVLAVVFGLLLSLDTLAVPWRPAHLIVYLVAAAFIALNSWWLPRHAGAAALAYDDVLDTPARDGLRPVAKRNALWLIGSIVSFFGGVAILGLVSITLR